jgi:hypothetical protein
MREVGPLSLSQVICMSWSWVRFSIPLWMALISAIPSVFANQTAESAQAPARSNAPQVTTQATCGQACMYHKANDNITIQVLYLINKVKEIEVEESEDKIRIATGAICNDSMEVIACKNRYKAFQAFALLQLRQAMGRNEDMMAKLTHGRQVDGSVSGQYTGFTVDEKLTPYTPDVPTLAELQKAFEKSPAEKKIYTQKQLKKWSESLVLSNPKANLIEFNKKPVVGNPHSSGQKNGYSLTMEAKDASGKSIPISKREEKLYDRAYSEVKKVADEVTDRKADPNHGVQVIAPKEILGKGQGKESADEISYRAYTNARSLVIDKVNQDSKKDLTERRPAQKPEVKTASPKSRNQGDDKIAAQDLKKSEEKSSEKPAVQPGEKGVALKKEPVQRKIAKDDEKISQPEHIQNSRYIRYDPKDVLDAIEDNTQPE